MDAKFSIILRIALVSAGIAVLCFFLGGVIADVATDKPILGVTFKASGALAGFVITFVVLMRSYRSLHEPLLVRAGVTRTDGPFRRTANPYKTTATVMKPSGTKTELASDALWEAGGLTVRLRGLEQDDLICIALVDADGTKWESHYFSPLCPSVLLNQVL